MADYPTTGAYISYERMEPFPLDSSSVFNSISKMSTYVNTDPSVYEGQLISVIDINENKKIYKVYSVAKDDTGFNPVLLMTNTGDAPTIAVDIRYDNIVSNLSAKNIQAAIDEISLHSLREIIITENLTVGDYRYGETLRYNHNFYMCKNVLGTKNGTDVSGEKFKNEFEMLIMINAENIFFDNTNTSISSNNISDCIKELSLHEIRDLLLTPDDKVIGNFKTNETVIFKNKIVSIIKPDGLNDGILFNDTYIKEIINFQALDIDYDNTNSKIEAVNVQEAIDKLSLFSFRELIIDDNNLTSAKYRKDEIVTYKGNLYSILIELPIGTDLSDETNKISPILEFKTKDYEIKNINNRESDIIYKLNDIIEYNNLLFRLTDTFTIKTTSNLYFVNSKDDIVSFIKDDIIAVYDERKLYISLNDSIDSVDDIYECVKDIGYGLYKISSDMNQSSLATDVKYSGITEIGGIKPNDILPKGMTFTDFVKKLLQPVIAPIYKIPTYSSNVNVIPSPVQNISTDKFIYETGTPLMRVDINGIYTRNDGGGLGGGPETPGKYEVYITKETGSTDKVINKDITSETDTSAIIDKSEIDLSSFIIKDGESVKIKECIYYKDGPIKKDNNGEPYPTGQIKSGSIIKEKVITSARYMWYGAIEEGIKIDSSINIKKIPNKKFNIFNGEIVKLKAIPGKTRQLIIAYPKFNSEGTEIQDVTDISSKDMGGSILDMFTKTEVEVTGANDTLPMLYKVYSYISPVILMGEDEYTVVI